MAKRSNDAKDALRCRILAIKAELPGDYIRQIQKAQPEYNSPAGHNRISNVVRLVITDEAITRLLERLVEITRQSARQLACFNPNKNQ